MTNNRQSVVLMRDLQRVAIVDPNDATRQALRDALLRMEEQVFLEAESSRYEFFTDVISQSCPDVVIVSLDSDQSKALMLIQQLTAEAPELPILAISARGDGQAILQALRSGAREFLTAPVILEELLKALKRLGPRLNGETIAGSLNGNGKVESQVIAVLGSRGGVGCTSIAVNLAACLAQEPIHSCALIDLDLALGDADVALDMLADYTLADVALNIERIDMTFLRRSLSKHASGVALLPHPVQIEDSALIRDEHLQRLVNLMRASYTHQVLDLSKSFSAVDIAALRLADVILLVAQLELSSLRNVVRMLLTIDNEPELSAKVKVVLNRVTSEGTDISLKKAEETIGRPIFWQVPNDPKAMTDSRNQGVPLLTLAPKCKVQQSLLGLSMALCGKEANAAPKEKSGRWSALFSRR
jgi:pilus assembly protein CpaE